MFFVKSENINFSKELAKYLYKELRTNNLNVKKDKILIYVYLDNDDYILIDCLSGKVFIIKNNEEKYLCALSNFKNKTHLGEAYNCAIYNTDKLIKKIENINNSELIKESNVEILDLRTKKNIFNKIILYINDTLYEGKSKIEILINYFKEKFNITKVTNDDINKHIDKYGEAYKSEVNKEIYIQEIRNISYEDFYNILKEKYPDFNIYKLFSSNRIVRKIAEKQYPKEAYEWVENKAEELINKENMDPDMAYGISWIQYKNSLEE